MQYIIIPSAKCAPDNLTYVGDLPMVLYPINGHTILHYIVSNYNSAAKVTIVGYEKVDRLEKYIKKEKYSNISLKKLVSLKDLGYSIFQAIKDIKFTDSDTLLINFADTLIDNTDITENCIIYSPSKGESNAKWTFVNEANGIINNIVDRCYDTVTVDAKIIVGVISIKNPAYFVKCLNARTDINGCPLYLSLKDYSEKYPFDFVPAMHWLDLGHPDEYFNSQISIKAREFNHMSFDKNRGILRKTSDAKSKFIGEINWYLKLPHKLQYVSPRIFDYCLDSDNLFVEMEFYSYPTIHELYLYGEYSIYEWKRIIDKIKFLLCDFSRYTISDSRINESLYDMYYTKTIERLKQLKTDSFFEKYFYGQIIVNGRPYKNLTEITEMLENIVKTNLLNIDKFCIIHGDMCFANMLIDDKLNFIKLIDPRGKFGSFDIYGDQRYEIAKLFHSVDGKYDCIIKDLFDITAEDNQICYKLTFEDNCQLYSLVKDFLAELIGDSLKEIEIIEALLFLSMVPLHNENKNHQMIMLATGLEILARNIDIGVSNERL